MRIGFIMRIKQNIKKRERSIPDLPGQTARTQQAYLRRMTELAEFLSKDYEEQYRLTEDFARWNLPEEIALEWSDAEMMLHSQELADVLSGERLAILQMIFDRFEELLPQGETCGVWTHEAMRTHPFWLEQRALACKFLNTADN